MKSPEIETIESLSNTKDRIDQITRFYAQGAFILDGMEAPEVACLLGVDIDGFADEGWEFSGEPMHSPDIDDLNNNDAASVVNLLWNRSEQAPMVPSTRLTRLQALAESIDNGAVSQEGTNVELLELTDEEICIALAGLRERILEGDAGWWHCAELKLMGANGWAVEFRVYYDDVDREASWRVVACS